MADKLWRVLTEPWSEEVRRASANGLMLLFGTLFGLALVWEGWTMLGASGPVLFKPPRHHPPVLLNASDAATLGFILMLIGAALLVAPLAYWFWNSLKR